MVLADIYCWLADLLDHLKGRFYSPAWHVFLNSDQGAEPNPSNQFAYCMGNPFMYSDPTGMDAGDARVKGHEI
jgi:RHS repeat-associated protein